MDWKRFVAQRDYSSGNILFYYGEKRDDKYYCPHIMETQEVELGVYVNPLIVLSEDEAQQFIDQLWQEGFRPSSENKIALGAQAKHLEDMRRIAFKFLEMQS